MTFYENLQNMPDLGTTIDVDGDYGRDHVQFLGGFRWFENVNRPAGSTHVRVQTLKDGAQIGAILLLNASEVALHRCHLARLDEGGTGAWDNFFYTRAVGYANGPLKRNVVVVDPWLRDSVPVGHAFWGIIKGPAFGLTPAEGDYAEPITDGLPVVSADSTTGRIEGLDVAPANQADAMAAALGVLGVSCQAQADPDSECLVFWNIPIF